MKTKKNLYENILSKENITNCFNEVARNTHNKARVANMKAYKSVYISRIYEILKNRQYVVGPYNHFVIYEPKKREIVSQNVIDKVVNHLVARFILYPACIPCLIDTNVASRKDLGTSKGIDLAKNFRWICNRQFNTFYILKCDIAKFFASIDHDILKQKLQRRIQDKDALKIVFDIIDSNDLRLIYRFNDKSNICYFLS